MTNKNQIAPQPLDTHTNVQNFEKWDFDRSEDTEIRKDIVCTFEQQDAEENLLEETENDTGEEYTGEWLAVKEDTETENGDDQVDRQKRQIEDRDKRAIGRDWRKSYGCLLSDRGI